MHDVPKDSELKIMYLLSDILVVPLRSQSDRYENRRYIFPRVNQKRIAVISQRRQLAWY